MKMKSLLFILVAVVLGTSPALAQSNSRCMLTAEKIVNLGKPTFGGAMKWKRTISQEEEKIGKVSLIRLFDRVDDFLVIGERHDKKTYATSMQIKLMDFNGKILSSLERDLKTKGRIIEVLHQNKKIVLLLEKLVKDGKRHAEIRIYTEDGKLLQSKTYKDERFVIVPSALVTGKDGMFYMATQHQQKNNVLGVSSVIYKLDKSLRIVWKRSFLPTTPSRIHAIKLRRNGGFIVAGEIAVPGGKNRQRIGGWLMALSSQGGMEWQREYPRGFNSRLNFVYESEKGHIFSAGTAEPSGDGARSVWVMTNYANSNPIWQRYFTGPYDYNVAGFHVVEPYFSSVLLQGTPVKKIGVSHVRLLDLSSLGRVLNDRSYVEGGGVEGSSLVAFEGATQKALERYILGNAQMPSSEGQDPILDGWIASIYKSRRDDPCQ